MQTNQENKLWMNLYKKSTKIWLLTQLSRYENIEKLKVDINFDFNKSIGNIKSLEMCVK